MIEIFGWVAAIVVIYFVSLVIAGFWMVKFPNSKVTKILTKVFSSYNKVLK